MNLLYVGSHAILDYDEIRLFSGLGVDVFAPGGYEVPSEPVEKMRPALPDAPHHPDLVALCRRQRERHGDDRLEGYGEAFDWAKADLHPDLIDWADTIMFAAYPERWLVPQWPKIRSKRVIWRTIGQSYPPLEEYVGGCDGLEIVRYSPKEREAFSAIGPFAGETAMIRFAKDPADYGPWIGDEAVVGNITQNMTERSIACGFGPYLEATEGLPTKPAGPGSQYLPGGVGKVEDVRDYLAHLRAYIYTGTKPASYTLGLIEAMLSGVPVIAIEWDDWAAPLSEAREITSNAVPDGRTAAMILRAYLDDRAVAANVGARQRERAIELFGIETVAPQWAEFLGVGVREMVAA